MDKPTDHHMPAHRAESQRATAVSLLGEYGIMRLSELKAAGVPYQTLARMAEDGSVLRVGRLHRLHPDKREIVIFDCIDEAVPMLARMSEKRIKGYRSLGYSISTKEETTGAKGSNDGALAFQLAVAMLPASHLEISPFHVSFSPLYSPSDQSRLCGHARL